MGHLARMQTWASLSKSLLFLIMCHWALCDRFPPGRGFIKDRAPSKLTSCERDLGINLPGCLRLLFLLSFIRKTKNARLKNPTDLLHKNLMKPLQEYLQKYWSSVLQTWHQKCASQNKQNDTYCIVANTLSSSLFLWKTKYPRLQPFWVGQGVILWTDMVPTLS